MTTMVTELVLSIFLFLAILAQMLPPPATLKHQPVVARRVVRTRNNRPLC
jgi:hypothetical protein